MKILIFPLLFRLMFEVGILTHALGVRGLAFCFEQTTFGRGVSPAVLKAVKNDNLQTAAFCWVLFFVGFFLDSIYKDLTYFLGKFWARIKYSSDHRGRRAGSSCS